MLSPTENSRIKGLFKAVLSDFSVLFKADLIFKDFSRNPSKFKYFSSLCQPWSINLVPFKALQLVGLRFYVPVNSYGHVKMVISET